MQNFVVHGFSTCFAEMDKHPVSWTLQTQDAIDVTEIFAATSAVIDGDVVQNQKCICISDFQRRFLRLWLSSIIQLKDITAFSTISFTTNEQAVILY